MHRDIREITADLNQLEDDLSALVDLCVKLRAENGALSQSQRELLDQRADMRQKNKLAKERIQTMLNRFKDMELDV